MRGVEGMEYIKDGKSGQVTGDREKVIELGNAAVNLSSEDFEIIISQLMKSEESAVKKLCALLVSKREA